MSTSDSTIQGKFDEIAGKAKQAFGDATGDQSAANNGAAQEVKGHAEQSWGSVKEAAHDTAERDRPAAQSEAHSLRDDVTSAAESVKQHIQNAADDFRNK
ncbi:MAG: CsbD family protein [Janthinobacterium lividum]